METERMCWTIVLLLIWMTLSCLAQTEDKTRVDVSCLEHQKEFNGSCYEFVYLNHTFSSAQAWCEQRGGHLAFIPDEESQYFLQRHADPKADMWFGVVPSASPNLEHSSAAQGPLSWLDDSSISYSNWVSQPQSGAACGHIMRDSGFQWEATKDCNKKLHFICQFESGRAIVCQGRNTTLQCGVGQVLMFGGGFYGGKNMHYCRSLPSTTTPTQHQCGWVDVVETLTAQCQGRQVCHITALAESLGEPCPQFGSYLSVHYHCKEVLALSVSDVAAVYDDVPIGLKWLLDPPRGTLNCTLNTGDGHSIHLHVSHGFQTTIVHQYTHPNTSTVSVECTDSDVRYTAQKIITIQEPITLFRHIWCHAGNLSFHATECKSLEGEPFQIQIQLNAGTNVTYRISKDEMLLSDLFVVRGNIPQNITVNPEQGKHLRPGCHQLTIQASNMVTVPEASTNMQMCVLERITGLQAAVLPEQSDYEESEDITMDVSLQRGAPAVLLFSLKGNNRSFSETRQMDTRRKTFHIRNPIKGPIRVKLRAWNIFSSLEVDVDMSISCGKDSLVELNSCNPSRFYEKMRNKHNRVARSPAKVTATTSGSMSNDNLKITLAVKNQNSYNTVNKEYIWACAQPCKCQGENTGFKHIVKGNCIPDPFTFDKYHFQRKNTQSGKVDVIDSICITFTPENEAPSWLSLSCTQGCDPIKDNTDAKIKMVCEGQDQCPQVVWHIRDPRKREHWPEETRSCYEHKDTKPLIETHHSGTEYTVSHSYLQKANNHLKVVVTYEDGEYFYKTFQINTKSSNSGQGNHGDNDDNDDNDDDDDDGNGDDHDDDGDNDDDDDDEGDTATPGLQTTGAGPTIPPSDTQTTAAPATQPAPALTTKTTTSKITTDITTEAANSPFTTLTANTVNTVSSMTPDITTNNVPTTVNTIIPEATSSPVTKNLDSLQCSISPLKGTILDAFTITCNTETPCLNCKYCFNIKNGKRLLCTKNNEVKPIFLPLGDGRSNHSIIIEASARSVSFDVSTKITAQVLDYTEAAGSPDNLSDAVENIVAELKESGQLSGQTVGYIMDSVSSKLNSQSNEMEKEEKQKLREQMLNIMYDTIKEAPSDSPEEVQVMARGLTAISQDSAELRSSAQEEASLLFVHLSSSLLHMDLNNTEENKKEMHDAASSIVEGIGNILHLTPNKNTSDALLVSLDNTMSALLAFQDANEAPAIIKQTHISMFVRRVTSESLHTDAINIPNCSCSSFSLPALPLDVLPSDDPVDVRMLSLDENPFSWKDNGNVSGIIGSLSLTTKDGSKIPVENLNDDVEIFLPRPSGEQVNTSVLDLGNYSTTVINVPSADTTLLLKMVPSQDPLPFKAYLGYLEYPTDTNHVAMTEMPHPGTTQKERYTWILDPQTLKGNTGVHYLVVRPIVGPGIKSINASLSITPITSECKFWDESSLDWSSNGCRVGLQSTHLVTQCLCNHLTFFGSSFFVTPNLVDPSRTAELFATFAENPVVVCFVGALFVTYLLAVIWARRKDIKDTAKVKVTVLEDNDHLHEYHYLLSVCTGHRRGASTSSQVAITLLGTEGTSEPHHLMDPKRSVFERGAVDMFLLSTPLSLGDLQAIRLWHNNSGSHPDWYVGNVMVQDLQTQQKWHCLCNSWLAIDIGDCSLDKVFPVSTEVELKRFSNLFFMKTAKDFSDGHLWYSVISRPPSSTFTCVQRVSCCFSLLLCTMLTSIMFYGIPTDPSEQTMDLGHFEFTWQQFMIGVQSSLIMFPVNIIIVSIFRNTRPWETSCCKCKAVKPDGKLSFPQNTTTNTKVTLDTVIKDVTRLALFLSKNVKSNIPCEEFGPGDVDINAILAVADDFIKQNNKTVDSAQSKTKSIHNPYRPQPTGSSEPSEEGSQQKCNKTQHLYLQLCNIDKELTLLGPSGFLNPDSYSQALQQVQGMKSSLEDQLLQSSSGDLDAIKKNMKVDSDDDDSSQKKKRGCCHGGLPWWFVFVGWLLVIATSVVSGYFTMLYGLKFGKERSVSWLVSMVISFFQSILLIQPLKVIFLAVFFAMLIKKVDDEDLQNLEFNEKDRNLGDCEDQQAVRRDVGLYAPPPPGDIEKMKRNKLMEQKAFALIKEILTYMGFMWMLLLVAYGQRDPNAYYLNRHIQQSFSRGITSSMSFDQVFHWANTSLLNNLFGSYAGFITDGNSKLVGNARLRQLRVQKNSCEVAESMQRLVSDCLAPYSWEVENLGSYDPGWNVSAGDDISNSSSNPWRYQTQAQLRSYPFWGKLVLYRGGGFVAELGSDLQNASSTLEYLFRNKWLDEYTRVIFVEFTVYNANVNLFCIVTLYFETTATGAFQFFSELQTVRLFQSTGGLHIFVMAAEIIYLLFIVYYMFLQCKLLKQQRWAYFRSKWNMIELTIILLSWSALAIFIKRTLLGNRDMTYYQNHKDQFASFYETAAADFVLQYLIAFVVLLSTIKLWHLLRLNPQMNLISATLHRAWADISGFLLVITVMILAYSIASNVIYNWKLAHYRTLPDAIITIISLNIGIFNYDEVLNDNPWLGGLLFGSCVVLMSYVVLNLLVSVILVAFNQEQINHKPSDEEEIVDLMLKKICSLFGIRYKNTKDPRGADVSKDMDLTLYNNKNLLNNSEGDVKVLHTP